ncbi:oleoyl-acyl carrier protein thioesterase, chloroplastic-like [Pyrus x bretschneideri]|uniref:oleoyl-acyl carrier protein thioesterase, chloroplastic-like n=1 Tax=Pyrus x bretschneideri TaxID=225117 RepID=UPI0020307FB5|nr:oleoyl-acyl carrier protein thioesterase, chloroplastic-like [Pyrus x bretschneideri]
MSFFKSKWVMMNQDTRRLQKVTDDVYGRPEEHFIFARRQLRLAFPEPNNSILRKIAKLEDPAHLCRGELSYVGWVL